ncbi:hypothetical protein [Nostoc sp.]|uniref:hypothetical protein n=1 Tax=Nostoc sp. TaxID=1180 RepID=UPI002FF626C3
MTNYKGQLISFTRRLEVTRQVLLPRRDATRTSRRSRPTHWLGYTGKTHLRGLKTFDFLLVHAGEREFV